MRTNLPVTNVEYVLKEGEAPTSRTDIHGNITYVNQDFVNVSGFSEEELIGQPQNIVRHPDMPREAFADLWDTIRRGKPWTGLVKNRCKDGGHYWVEANVAPIVQDGQTVGYTSVRMKPSREQVEAAENAYRAIRAGNTDLVVHEGKALTRLQQRRARIFAGTSLRVMFAMAASVIGVLFGGVWLFAWLAKTGQTAYLDWLEEIGAVGMPMALMFGITAYRGVSAPLMRTRREIDRLSSGDLTGRIESDGLAEMSQLMQSVRVMQTNLKWLLGQIKESTDLVATGAHEIASGNVDLSGRTESQASSLEETASSMEELTGTVRQNAEHAQHANQLVGTTAEVAAKGGAIVARVVDTMTSIKDSSRRIAEITGVIDSIAFQTNILALNAAVEAARAGEQGRGFAVVATEVRSLAQRSAGAAKEIKVLIDDSVGKVEAGGKLVDETGEAMGDIVTSVQLVADIMNGIATASREQSAGIEQVNQAVGQMDEMTQQNAALVEQAAAAAESLQEQAAKLSQLVANFRLSRMAGHEMPSSNSRVKTNQKIDKPEKEQHSSYPRRLRVV